MRIEDFDKLHQEWQALKRRREAMLEETDNQLRAHLQGQGEPPGRKRMDEIDDLLFQESEARGKIDAVLSEYAS